MKIQEITFELLFIFIKDLIISEGESKLISQQ